MRELIIRVGLRIADEGLSEAAAAAGIGVGVATLRKHLAGEYVRSDTAAKYRRWLAGSETVSKPLAARAEGLGAPSNARASTALAPWVSAVPGIPAQPLRVVDLFSGCGGLSLGFDLASGGNAFDTVLAVDIERAMLTVYNANRQLSGRQPVGRLVDLADLTSEAEALAFYLVHLEESGQADQLLSQALEEMPRGRLSDFRASVATLDRQAMVALRGEMASQGFQKVLQGVPSDSLKQTSVISFHEALRLPRPGTRAFRPPVLWWDSTEQPIDDRQSLQSIHAPKPVRDQERKRLSAEWDVQVESLRSKITRTGRGQLASSARRIKAFLDIVDSGAYSELYKIWLDWRVRRDALRNWYFEDSLSALRNAYSPWQISVLLGGAALSGFQSNRSRQDPIPSRQRRPGTNG